MLLQSQCIKCGGLIDYDVEDRGKTIECPSCHDPTPLFGAAKKQPKSINGWLLTGILISIVICIFASAIFAPVARIPVLLAAGIAIYFAPSIIGRQKENFGAILLLNIFLGWTLVGWVVSLVWAATKDRK